MSSIDEEVVHFEGEVVVLGVLPNLLLQAADQQVHV
jgi:hypothetical protein